MDQLGVNEVVMDQDLLHMTDQEIMEQAEEISLDTNKLKTAFETPADADCSLWDPEENKIPKQSPIGLEYQNNQGICKKDNWSLPDPKPSGSSHSGASVYLSSEETLEDTQRGGPRGQTDSEEELASKDPDDEVIIRCSNIFGDSDTVHEAIKEIIIKVYKSVGVMISPYQIIIRQGTIRITNALLRAQECIERFQQIDAALEKARLQHSQVVDKYYNPESSDEKSGETTLSDTDACSEYANSGRSTLTNRTHRKPTADSVRFKVFKKTVTVLLKGRFAEFPDLSVSFCTYPYYKDPEDLKNIDNNMVETLMEYEGTFDHYQMCYDLDAMTITDVK